MFVHRRDRFEALAYVLVIACLVYTMIERRACRALRASGEILHILGKRKTFWPTAQSLLDMFTNLTAGRPPGPFSPTRLILSSAHVRSGPFRPPRRRGRAPRTAHRMGTFVEDGYDPDRFGIVRLPLITWTPAADEVPGLLGYVQETASAAEHEALRLLALLQLEMEQPALLICVPHTSIATHVSDLLTPLRGSSHAVYWNVPGSSFVVRTVLRVTDTEIAGDTLAAAGYTVKRVRNRTEDRPDDLLEA